jgi:MFS family permease
LIMPQAAASMSMKLIMRWLLNRVGYRGVLISNTIIIGGLLILFAAIRPGTTVWEIVLLAFWYGGFTSLQYTSMNTLVYADISDELASNASSIASTTQQLSVSFGVAIAGLTTAIFLPESTKPHPALLIRGIHKAFISLGMFTAVTSLIFSRLKSSDGESVSQHKVLHAG